MADDEKNLKDVKKKLVAASDAVLVAIDKTFPGWDESLAIQINAIEKATVRLDRFNKGIDASIKDYMIKKGIPEDTVKKMFPKYKADYNKKVLPKIVELQNIIKEYRGLGGK